MRRRSLLIVLVAVLAAACYRLYDGLEDQWTVYFTLYPMQGQAAGSCTPITSAGQIELFRDRNAGLRGTFDRDSIVCTSSAGTIVVPEGRDTIVSGLIIDQTQDSLTFTFGQPNWVFYGRQVERHFLAGYSRLAVNDTLVFEGNWQADRR